MPEELTGMLPEGDYIVECFLGQGGMGAVYRGLQLPLKRPVAIKIMQRKHIEDDYHFEDRFRREAYVMASLTHPNVVQVYDCGDAGDGFLFISMELVEGGDLSRAMKSGLVTPESALQLFIPICEGVQAAHEHGLVHRDIKPANIFLTIDVRPKVADFGLAKKFDAQSTFMTKTGLGMGTPDYAAPEQYEELADLDHRADIYSLGVMFYQMLTGHLPRGAYKAPSQLVEVDARLDAVVQKAMQTDRAERYQRVEEMKADVEHIISTWMAPPKPRFVTPAGVPTRTGRVLTATGRVPTHTGRVLTATGRVPTHTGRVPTVPGRVPSHTGRVPAATGRVPIAPRLAPLQPPSSPVHMGPVSTAQQGEHVTQASPKKSGTVMFAGLLAAAVIVGGGAFVALRKPGPVSSSVAAAQAEPGSSQSSSSLVGPSSAQVERINPATSSPPLPIRPVVQTLDLLALTDPVRDRISVPGLINGNEWVREGTALVYNSDGKSGKIAAPVAFECRDYEIELQVERLGGSGRLHLDLPVAGTRILPLILNDPSRRILNEKEGVNWPHNAPMIHVTIRVARGGGGGGGDRLLIRDKISGKEILDWKGRLGQSGKPGETHAEFPGAPVTSLVAMHDPYAVRMWRLSVFEGRARELRKPDESAPPGQSEILAFGGHRYQAVTVHIDWKAAKAKAEEMGGRLAIIESKEEHEALKKAFGSRIPSGSGLWLGASTAEGPAQMRWMSGGAMSFTVWAKGEPNERTGAVMMMRGLREPDVAWADFPLHGRGQTVTNRGFIVEWENTEVAAASVSPAVAVPAPPAPPASGAPSPQLPGREFADPRLAQLESGFKSRYDADVQKPYATALATLNAGYLRALATARAAAQKVGNLTELTAIDEEAARTKSGRPPPPADVIGTPETLVKLRGTFRSAMARHMAVRDRAAVPLYDLYLKALDGYIAELTKANNITRAKEVQDLRREIAAQKPVIDPPVVVEASAGARPPASARGTPVANPAIEVSTTSSWRQLATWVLSMNGQLHVDRDGTRIQVTAANPKDLPSGKFSVRYVSLTDGAANARLTDDDLTLLVNAPDLEFLDIRDAPEITRVPALRGMKKLGRIMLHRCPKMDPSLFAELAGKQNLSDVDVYGSMSGVQGISSLASCPKLANLILSSTPLDDASLAEVGKLKSLHQLQLDNTRITDEGLPSLATLTALESLTLDGCAGVRGRTMSALMALTNLKHLGLRNVRFAPEHFPAIGRFVSLELLALDSMPGVDDEALAALGNLSRLQSLVLYGTDVTGTGLVSMKASKDLKHLNLGSKAPVTNEGLQAIAATFPALTGLSLGDGGTWNADGLKALAALEDLKTLFAQGPNGRGDRELEVIGGFKQLDSLSLPNFEITDGGLAKIANLKLLTSLDLGGAAAVSDGAIPVFGKLRGLRSLQLRGTAVSDAGIAALKKQLPSANITR